MNRTELYRNGLRQAKTLMQDEIAHGHNTFSRATHHYALVNASPLGLHTSLFIGTLKLQASPEQLAYWLPLAKQGKIIGTYCQTELGHGTFFRGLETTATFDASSDEFVLHSPTLTSTKYWPGGLGLSCSHAIVMARLIARGTDHGVHPFMVQLRSLDDYRPLPGIELGDVGLKMGLNGTDNGYAIFNHSLDSQLAQAVTIATRYSIVREQGGLGFGNIEVVKLLTLMSRAFALVFAFKACDVMCDDLITRQRAGDNGTLSYGHITTAALKAYATQVATDGCEDARRCCGGHGYSALSGLPEIINTITPTVTVEGENYVLYQQTARYLVKAVRLALAGLELLQDAQAQDSLGPEEAWNLHMIPLISAARAHIEYFVLQAFINTLSCVQDTPSRNVLQKLCSLFALSMIESPLSFGSSEFFEDGYISLAQLRMIRSQVNILLSELLPEAIGLTDAWNFSDASLQSALGRKDGNVYETLCPGQGSFL
ncbi:acyl-CoA dehydrogenase/oxidase [Infundibulicybe gibba]|nr:acyl-CoA dehydrogenase/oxidase [Infundibulicybe gibba]